MKFMVNELRLKFVVFTTLILVASMMFIPVLSTVQADRALVFSINTKVNDDTGSSMQNAPVVAIGTPGYCAVWDDYRNGLIPDIYFGKSTDGGLSFDTNVRVDDDTIGASQTNPTMAINGNTVYVTWQDDRLGDYNIRFAKSTNGGDTFGPSVRVDDSTQGNQQYPSIMVAGNGDIYIVWQDNRRTLASGDYDIYFSKSTDGGATFNTNVRVDSTGSSDYDQKYPKIAIGSGNNIYVVWQDSRNGDWDIYFTRSTNAGSSFNTNIRIDHTSLGPDQVFPEIGADSSGNVYVIWEDDRNGATNPDIYMSKSTDSGASFGSSDIRVDNTGTDTSKQTRPVIDLDNTGALHIAWGDTRNDNSDIYYTSSTDGGATFENDRRVDDTGTETSIQEDPAIAVTSMSNVCLGWKDKRDSNFNIYFSRLVEEGTQGYAPSVYDGAIDNEMGGESTEFKYTVKYADKENNAPAEGYPKLYIYKDTSGTSQIDNSPFSMTKQTFPSQDGDYTNGEIYEYKIVLGSEYSYSYKFEAKADSGNLSNVFSTLYQGPIVDLTPVNYTNPTPSTEVWNNELMVACNITITDFNGAGVDTDSIQYAFSFDGKDNYDVWKAQFGMITETGPDWVNCSVDIAFQNGVGNYIKWRAADKLGNGPVESPDYQIKVDINDVSFANPNPEPEFWNNELNVDCEITINDNGGSGVDADSIQYLLTVGGISSDEWVNAGQTIDADSIECSVNVMFQEGTDNSIKWRAFDVGGNGPSVSEAYQIKIDLDRELNHKPEPPTSGDPVETAAKRPNINWNQGSDEDDDELKYWIQIGTSSGGNEILKWVSVGPATNYEVKTDLVERSYYVQIMANDGEYNSTVFEYIMNVTSEGNTPPQPPSMILPDKAGAGNSLRIEWTGAIDADYDNLSYLIQIGTYSKGSDILFWNPVGQNQYYDVPTNYAFISVPGIYYIQIKAYDGNDFSYLHEEILEIVDYQPLIDTESVVNIEQSKTNTTSIIISNLGTSFDNITINLTGPVASQATLVLDKNTVSLQKNTNTSVQLSIKLSADIAVQDHELVVTATSEDGKTKFQRTIIIRVSKFTGKTDENGDASEDESDTNPLVAFFLDFWWLILILIIVLVAAGIIGGTMRTKKQEEMSGEKARQEEYERLYGHQQQDQRGGRRQTPPPPPTY
jgi:hypothetical protein